MFSILCEIDLRNLLTSTVLRWSVGDVGKTHWSANFNWSACQTWRSPHSRSLHACWSQTSFSGCSCVRLQQLAIVVTRYCPALTAGNIWRDFANSQCYCNPDLSLQQEIYGRTLRFRNVITIHCRAYSNKYMAWHCEFAMLSQSSVELTARNIWQDIGNSQCYHNTVSSLQQEIYGGHCECAMLSQSSVELTARNIWQDIANSQCYHNPLSSLQQGIYGRTLPIRNVITIQFQACSKKDMADHCEFAMLSQSSVEFAAINIWQDIANSQCYHDPVSSLQQWIYGRTLRICNLITIQFRAYSLLLFIFPKSCNRLISKHLLNEVSTLIYFMKRNC